MTAKLVKFVAGATAIAANTFVKLSSGLTVEQASATAIDCIGVQTNATVSGDIAIVCVEGPCQLKVAEALTAHTYVRPHTAGEGQLADAAGNVRVAIYYGQEVGGTVETVADNDLVTVHVLANKTTVVA